MTRVINLGKIGRARARGPSDDEMYGNLDASSQRGRVADTDSRIVSAAGGHRTSESVSDQLGHIDGSSIDG